jgi:hypothetical protein
MSPDEGSRSSAMCARLNTVSDELPRTLDGAKVLRYAPVAESVESTGRTRHFKGSLLGPASALAIARYEDSPESGYYLFYLDDGGVVVTDTNHDSMEAALDQAAFEYAGLVWSDVAG